MRISQSIRFSICKLVREQLTGAQCYLFGSRANDEAKGGDIDLLLITDEKLSLSAVCRFRRQILSVIGEQKIDIVNFTKASDHPFKSIALETAVEL